MKRLDAKKLDELDFYRQTSEDVEYDGPVVVHRGFTIALCTPNGGIVGVSIWHEPTEEYYAKPTELLPNSPGYDAHHEHIKLAKQAIDAALINDGQLSLLEK